MFRTIRSAPARVAGLAASALFVSIAPSCGDSGPNAHRAATRVRLTEHDAGELTIAADPDAGELVARLAGDPSAWSLMTDSAHPLDVDTERVDLRWNESGDGAILSGNLGSLYRIARVEPSTAYSFEGAVRARDVAPAALPFYGANLLVLELSTFGAADEIAAGGVEDLIVRRHLFPSATGAAGEWAEIGKRFRTAPSTRALLIACVLALGVGQEVSAGEVDFRGVEVRRLSDRRFREHLLARSIERFSQGEETRVGWRALRFTRASLGAEERPSIVLLPGDALRLSVELPGDACAFELGVGPWREGLADVLATGASARVSASVRVAGASESSFDEQIDPGSRELGSLRWTERRMNLDSRRGGRVEFELRATGNTAVAFGAPVVRATGVEHERPNVLLISIDTLRRDRVGLYGYPEGTTPRIDAFARGAIVFDDATCQAPYTLPSHATMFSGQFPSVHGVQDAGHVLSSRRSPVLARILADVGYRTQAFTGGGFLNPDFGFDRGFDGFVNVDPLRQRESEFLLELTRREPQRYSAELVRSLDARNVQAWMAAHADEPFFLFVHTYVVHDYDPPDAFKRCAARGCTNDTLDIKSYKLGAKRGWNPHPYTAEERAHLGHLYDDSLRFIDDEVGALLDQVDTLGLADDTIVVITTDHGEEMLERGFVQHGKTLYEEIGRIPLIVRIPGEAPRHVESPAMLVDLVPTLLAALDLPGDARAQGVDLLRAAGSERPVWSEIHDSLVHRYALRDDAHWKLIHSPEDDEVLFPPQVEWELFDLDADPGERTNLAASEPERLEALRTRLERVRATLGAASADLDATGTGVMDPETRSQLEGLGYFGEVDE